MKPDDVVVILAVASHASANQKYSISLRDVASMGTSFRIRDGQQNLRPISHAPSIFRA